MENGFRGDIHGAIDEQLAMFRDGTGAQENSTQSTHFVPGTLGEVFSQTELTPAELRHIRQEAQTNGIHLPESDQDLQKLIRDYHAESLHND